MNRISHWIDGKVVPGTSQVRCRHSRETLASPQRQSLVLFVEG